MSGIEKLYNFVVGFGLELHIRRTEQGKTHIVTLIPEGVQMGRMGHYQNQLVADVMHEDFRLCAEMAAEQTEKRYYDILANKKAKVEAMLETKKNTVAC
jgi:hypothetical protein